MNPPYWRQTLLGVALVIALGSLVGCQPEGDDAPRETIDPSAIEVPAADSTVVDPRTTEPERVIAPAGAQEGYIGNPDVAPNLQPHSGPGRDPDWDCSPTGNTSIDDWKRDAKCGGKLDGE